MALPFVAEQLNILPSEAIPIQGVHGIQNCNLYIVDMLIPEINHGINSIPLIEINFSRKDKYHAIIGMDIIAHGTLHFNFRSSLSPDGICTFCM